MKHQYLIGRGILNWPSKERRSDRYGLVLLAKSMDDFDAPANIVVPKELKGKSVQLLARILEIRRSLHMGDLARSIFPSTPKVGDEFILGTGVLFQEECDEFLAIGVRPKDKRRTDWMDPNMLYRCIHQTVELIASEK